MAFELENSEVLRLEKPVEVESDESAKAVFLIECNMRAACTAINIKEARTVAGFGVSVVLELMLCHAFAYKSCALGRISV